jgi:N-terminal half of MaoC dehydratase
MPIDSSLIGNSSEPKTFKVTREAVERFMRATEDPALPTNTAIEYAPPTFPTTFRVGIPALELDSSKMQLIHGEMQYDYTRRLKIGEDVTCVVRIADIRERAGRSGPMTFVVTELVGIDTDQQPVFTARSTLIVRTKQ